MWAKRLLNRVLPAFGMSALVALILAVLSAHAMPIRPNLKKVFSERQNRATEYVPARAGWNGPEISASARDLNPTYERLTANSASPQGRRELIAAAIPDLRILAAIALIILLIRRIRNNSRKAQLAAVTASAQPRAPAEETKLDDKLDNAA